MTNDANAYLAFGSSQGNLQTLALGTSTSETAFSVNGNSAVNPAFAAGSAILKLKDTQPVLAVGTSISSVFAWDAGKPFFLQAWGQCTTGTSANLTLTLYQVPASVVAAGLAVGTFAGCNKVATSTARAVNSTTKSFFLEAFFQWNATSGLLEGQFSDQIGNLLDAWAVTTETTTATLADNELNFLLTATLSSGNAANQVKLMEFAQMNQ
jgi:hypothetical protein